MYYCIEEITERVQCYRVDLGLYLNKTIKNLKNIFDKLIIACMDRVEFHKHTTDLMYKESVKSMDELRQSNKILELHKQDIMKLYECQRSESEFFCEMNEASKNEIEILKTIIENFNLKNDLIKRDSDNIKNKKKKENSRKQLEEEQQPVKEKTEAIQDVHEKLKEMTTNFNDIITNWETQQNEKKENLAILL